MGSFIVGIPAQRVQLCISCLDQRNRIRVMPINNQIEPKCREGVPRAVGRGRLRTGNVSGGQFEFSLCPHQQVFSGSHVWGSHLVFAALNLCKRDGICLDGFIC